MNGQEFYRFPKDFYWGSATSAHQVEGNNINDWTEWEKQNAKRLAAEAEKKFSHLNNWEQIKTQAQNPQNYISGSACNHYNLYETDFDLIKSLNHNAYRFSIEWSRVEPKEGYWDNEQIAHYRAFIKALLDREIEPFVTLWHWSLPLWLRDKGGVRSKGFADYFVRYALKMVEEFGQVVKFWITLNEPEIYCSMSFLKGEWPPQKKNPIVYLLALQSLVAAHQKAYKLIKDFYPNANVGIAKNNIYFEATKSTFTGLLKKVLDWWWNFYFLNRIKNHQDFIGLNYYFYHKIQSSFFKSKAQLQDINKKVSDMGWEIYPQGIFYLLKDLKRFDKPIYITESGLADAKDEKRSWFIFETLKNVNKALEEGVDVKGYFYWSLMDNFEWDKGFWPRFGLLEVDYKTMERKIRKSAYDYTKIIKSWN